MVISLVIRSIEKFFVASNLINVQHYSPKPIVPQICLGEY